MKIVVDLYHVLVPQFGQDVVLLFLRHLLLNIIKARNFHSIWYFTLRIRFLIAHVDRRVQSLTDLLPDIIELLERPLAFLFIIQLIELLRAVLDKS